MDLSQDFGAIFSVIGAVSIVSNALFCLLLFRKPVLLKKAHNIILLMLATIDMMTGKLNAKYMFTCMNKMAWQRKGKAVFELTYQVLSPSVTELVDDRGPSWRVGIDTKHSKIDCCFISFTLQVSLFS